jgi:CRP-like cAMP-binding protein
MLIDDLRSTFLFEKLSDEQLKALTELGMEVACAAGETVFIEGQPADFLWVLLDGELELTRHVGGQRVVIGIASRPGTYAGGLRAFAGSAESGGYRATGKTLQPSRFFRLPSAELDRLLSEWSPLAKHLLDGYVQGMESIAAPVRAREHLISLGKLAAGLAHELNNPAAAAMRATGDLRRAVAELQVVMEWVSKGEVTPDQIRGVLELRDRAAAQADNAPELTAIETANREEEVGSWLEEHEVENPWELASTLLGAGLDLSWLEKAASALASVL